MTDPKKIPTEKELQAAASTKILNSKGQELTFGSVYADSKVIVVFIRHFMCGRCQAYVEELSKIKQEKLNAANVKLVVIGCGDWQALESYTETTGYKGEIFADPTRKIYHIFGMIENLMGTPAGEKKRSYASSSTFNMICAGVWRALRRPGLIGKQGSFSQLGGEFIFGPGNICTFASRMRHIEDHIEVADLLKEAGVADE